jgi:hypothetical protein
MSWVVVVVIGTGWLFLAVPGALVIGRSIHLAEQRQSEAGLVLPPGTPGGPSAHGRPAHGRRPGAPSRAVSACLTPTDRKPTSWENELS